MLQRSYEVEVAAVPTRLANRKLIRRVRRLGLYVLRVCAIPFRPLPKANIGLQLTLLSLVTTLPFLLLIAVWSFADAQPGRTLVGAAWATVAAIGLGILAHRRLSVPVEVLAHTAQRIGRGEFSARVKETRGDELGELARTMNTMAANIERLTKELDAARDRMVRSIAAEAAAWEQTSKLQDEFIALASHELCAPLGALQSYAEALRKDLAGDEAERAFCLERIEHLSDRLGGIVRNLLSVSRIRSGQLTVRTEDVPLSALLDGCVQDFRRRQPAAAVAVQVPSGLPALRADPGYLEEIVHNLLSNATRYAPEGMPVRVWAEAVSVGRAARVRLHVRDDGPGLSVKQQGELFQRVGRSDRSAGTDGLGLGLYICRAYVDAMRGRIWVTSAPGQGATFTVELPAASAA